MEPVKVAIRSNRSDSGLGFSSMKIDQFGSFVSNRGTCSALGSLSWTKKQDTELYRSNDLNPRSITEDASREMDNGVTNGSVPLVIGSEGKQVQQREGRVASDDSRSFKKQRMFQADNVLPQPENGDGKIELDMLGSHFLKVDNSQAVKHKNNINGRRGDKRNSRAPMKAKFDPFALKAGLSSLSPAARGCNIFGKYGLKPDIHDVTKFMEDVSINVLLDGTYKCPTFSKDEGKRIPNVDEDVLDSVRKVCSLILPQEMQQGKQAEELDIHAVDETSMSSPPSDSILENNSSSTGTIAGLSNFNKDSNVEGSVNLSDTLIYQPRDVREKLALPTPKDLESLLQDAVTPAASMKLTDSRSSKQLSHRDSLPPFPWSHNFNGHHKSNNDALKTFNKSTCFGKWVRISSTARSNEENSKGFVDLESLTYDDSLVPAGQLKYRLPEVSKTSTAFVSQHHFQPEVSPPTCPPTSLPFPAQHSHKVLAAARTLCDMASNLSKNNSSVIPKWPKQTPRKAMKAHKSRLNEIPEEEFTTPKSKTTIDHVVRSVEYGSSSKKSKISSVEWRENYSHVQTVIGLSSVSAPRSNRSSPSPSRLSKDSFSEARLLNGSVVKSSFMLPPLPRVLDRSSQNPQKLRKIT